jgi:translocation and assembly module TamB
MADERDDVEQGEPVERRRRDEPMRARTSHVLRNGPIYILIGLLALVAFAWWGLQTGPGLRFIANQIAKQELDSCLSFKVSRLEGSPFGKLTLHDVRIYDLKSFPEYTEAQERLGEDANIAETFDSCPGLLDDDGIDQRDAKWFAAADILEEGDAATENIDPDAEGAARYPNAAVWLPEVVLDWNPLSFYFDGLDIDSLTSEGGVIRRQPVSKPSTSGNLLPGFDIRIGELAITRLSVADELTNNGTQQIALTGSTHFQRGNAILIRDRVLKLNLDADLGGTDDLFLQIDAEPDSEEKPFDIRGRYVAAPDGFLAAFTGTDAAYTGVIDGDGTWDDWDGDVLLRRDGETVLAAGLAKLTEPNNAAQDMFRVSGRGDPRDILGPGLLRNAMAGGVLFDLSGELSGGIFTETGFVGSALQSLPGVAGGNEVVDAQGFVRTEAFETQLDGAYDLVAGRAMDLEVLFELLDPDLFGDGFLLDGAFLRATLDGLISDLRIEHLLAIDLLDLGGTQFADLRQQGVARWDGTRLVLPLSASLSRIVSGNAMADERLVDGRVNGTLAYVNGRLLSDDLGIRFPGLQADLALCGDLESGAVGLAGPVRAQDFTIDNLGRIDVNSRIDFAMASGVPWRLNAQVDGRMATITNDTLANLSGGNIRFAGGISLAADRPILFNDTTIRANKVSATLDGRFYNGQTSVVGRGRHVDYGPFTVDAALADDGPRAVLVFADPLPAAGLSDVRVALAPTENGFRIDTEGGSTLGPFEGQIGLISPTNGPTRIAIDRFNIWKTSLTGDLVVGDSGLDGSLALAGGGLDGTIGLASRGGAQGFVVDVQANNASFGGTTDVSIANADIDARGQVGGGNTTVQGTLDATGIRYGSLFIGRAKADASLQNGSGEVNAAITGRRGSRFALQTNTQFTPERIALALRGELAGRDITMPRRAVLLKAGDAWELQRSSIRYGDGGIALAGLFGGGETRVDLDLDDMPLSLVDVTGADLGLGGTISGSVEYNGAPGGPTGSAQVKIAGLSRSGLVLTSRPVDVALNAQLTPQQLGFRATINEGGARRGRLQGRIGGLAGGGAFAERLQSGDLNAQLRFDGPADALWRLAAIETFDLTGPVAVAANVTGTLRNPQLRGSMSADDLRMRSALTGTDVRSIEARGRFDGSRLRLTRFAGQAANGGSVSGSGIIDISDLGERGPRIDLKLATRNAALLNRTDLKATITGPMRIVSDGINGTIAGRLAIENASWSLGGAATTTALPNVKTRDINLPADRQAYRNRSAPWRYLIDAKTVGRIDVDGMGLDSEWGADVLLRGTTEDPRIGGRADYIRGSYTFAGTRFELTRGTIYFDENAPIDPRLDIRAETQQNGLDVQVQVTGRAQQPEIAFTSTPALPEEELLARLLFGGSITDLSATDALQLGAALASLRGGGGMDPINKLRTAIGLDRLRIVSADPALDRGTAIALGKNITNRFYAELITDGQGYSATEVEFRVTSWLSLLASVSTVGRNGVRAEYRRDY